MQKLLPVLLILFYSQTNAQSGLLDPAFNYDGIASASFSHQSSYDDIAFQQDGKILCGGTINDDGQSRPLLMRYKKDGQPDSSFGINGVAAFESFMAPYMQVKDVTVQGDGKIYAAGVDYDATYSLQDFFIVKYKPNGGPDSSFNGNGIVRTAFGAQPFGELGNVLVQGDGKIVIAGYVYNDQYQSAFIVSRYNHDGSIDESFGNNGIATIGPGNNGDNICITAAMQADGKILLAGAVDFFVSPSDGDFVFVRFNTNGSPDSSFGVNGVTTVDNGGRTDLVTKMIVQPDGKIIACGTSSDGTNTPTYRSVLLRLNANGTKDGSFGNNGIVFSLLSDLTSFLFDIAVQGDGKVVCAGSVYKDGMVFYGGDKSVLLARYNPDGSADNSLGGCGIVTTAIESNGNSEGIAIGLFDNRIYIAGAAWSSNSFESGFIAAYKENNIVLPVSLLNFSATRKNNVTALLWQTAFRADITSYTIQRSADGLHFDNIGSVRATNSFGTATYTYDDPLVINKEIFYRLQMVNADGKFTYSRIVRIAGIEEGYALLVYPNPARDVIQVMLTGLTENGILQIIDASGKMVKQINLEHMTGNTSFAVNIQQLPAGVYHLMMGSKSGILHKKFIRL